MNAVHTPMPDRLTRVAQQRTVYRYVRQHDGPPHVRQLPESQTLPRDTQRYIDNGFRRIAANRLFNLVRRRGRPVRSVEELATLYRTVGCPSDTVALWDHDRFWGWMHLAGVNPMQLRRLEGFDDAWAVRSSHLRGLLPSGCDLEHLLGEQRLFYTDYSVLRGVHRMPGRYLAEPRCLFWLDEEAHLQPLAIQRFSGAGQAVFTPLGNRWDWRLARAWAQNASNHTHQALYHLLETHLVPEALALGLHRNLTPSHPVARLLSPHFEQVMGINALARELLLSPGGMVDRAMSAGAAGAVSLMRDGYQSFSLSERGLEADVASRGLASSAVLADFPYRDDARRVLGALGRYTRARVALAYVDDAAVLADVQLSAWLAELGDPRRIGLGGVPTVTTREGLARFLADVVFRCSAQHHAMNRGQFESYGFVPFTPAGLYRPADWEVGTGSEALFLASLPDVGHCLSQVGSAFLLSRPAEKPMMKFDPGDYATEGDARATAGLRCDLSRISAEIGRINRHRYLPYTHLDPAAMATCVDI